MKSGEFAAGIEHFYWGYREAHTLDELNGGLDVSSSEHEQHFFIDPKLGTVGIEHLRPYIGKGKEAYFGRIVGADDGIACCKRRRESSILLTHHGRYIRLVRAQHSTPNSSVSSSSRQDYWREQVQGSERECRRSSRPQTHQVRNIVVMMCVSEHLMSS